MLLSSELVLYKKTYVTVNKSMNIIEFVKKKQKKNGVCYSVLPLVHFELQLCYKCQVKFYLFKSRNTIFFHFKITTYVYILTDTFQSHQHKITRKVFKSFLLIEPFFYQSNTPPPKKKLRTLAH